MNPVFWLIIILALALLWFLLSFAFRPIGKVFFRLWKDAFDEINKIEEEKEN